ncbi:MAG: hypothetical protein KC609_21865 [Myxococcales bacterium]|nr:hypothetical protein [Myxococcales bacterium]
MTSDRKACLLRLPACICIVLLLSACTSGQRRVGQLSCVADSDCTGGLCVADRCLVLASCGGQGDCADGVCSEGYCWTAPCGGDGDCSYGTCSGGYCVRISEVQDVQNDTSNEDQPFTPDTTVAEDSSGNAFCDDGLGKMKPGACGEGTFCAKDAICRVATLLVGEPCGSAVYNGEDENKACVSGICRPAAFEDASYCVEKTEQCGSPTTPVESGAFACSTDKLQVKTCGSDGRWQALADCRPTTCNSGSGKQERECGSSGCQLVGGCLPCYPGKFSTALADCSTKCSQNSDCPDGAECQSQQCVALTSKQVDCDPDNNNPPNSQDVLEQVTVSFDPNNGWTPPAKCKWSCVTDYALDGAACVNQKQVPCDQSGSKPTNASWNVVDVPISYTTAGGWTTPAACSWSCDATYCKQGSTQCLSSKQVSCSTSGTKPTSSSWTVQNVTVTCQPGGSFSSPAACSWSCDTGYCQDGASQCLSSKQVSCSTSGTKPTNSSWTVQNVTVTCQSGGTFSSPSACSWSCNNNFCLDAGSCLSTKSVSCSSAATKPTQSDWVSSTVTITCSGSTWSTPSCSWICKSGYVVNKAGNDCVRPLYLVSAAGTTSAGGNRSTMNTRCSNAVSQNYGSLGTTKTVGFITISSSDQIKDLPTNQSVPTNRPILGPTGTRIADDWADLLDGSIKTTLMSAGTIGNNYWYSGSDSSGAEIASKTCSGWTLTSGSNAAYGHPGQTDARWITNQPASCGLATYYYLCLTWIP